MWEIDGTFPNVQLIACRNRICKVKGKCLGNWDGEIKDSPLSQMIADIFAKVT